MKKWVLGIILSLSATFLIGISNCSALSSNFGSIGYSDINTSGISSLTGATSNYVLIYEDDIQSVGGIWLFFLNSNTAYLSTNNLSSDYINDICSTEGGCFSRLYSSAGTNPKLGYKYYSLDNGNTWVLYSSATNHLSTDPLPYSYIVYTTANLKNVFNTSSTLYSSGYYYDAPISIDLLINIDRVSSYSTNLIITLDDVGGLALGGDVLYSYNNSDWYSLGIDEAGEVATLPVYTNGGVYFKILDSEDNIIYSTTYNVTGMPSINGYSLYEIEKGNIQVYISNLGNSTTGNFYIPYGMKGFSDSFTFLDSNGDFVGSQIFNYTTYEDLGVDTVSGSDLGLVSVPYDFSNLQNVKIITFNHNSNDNLIIWVPTGFYVDYVSLDNKGNYHCEGDSNINDSTNLAKCYLKFDYNDNGTISEVTDSTNNATSMDVSFFGSASSVITSSISFLSGITLMFTSFLNGSDSGIVIVFYAAVVLFLVYFIISLFKH